jgi:hypothetical protein
MNPPPTETWAMTAPGVKLTGAVVEAAPPVGFEADPHAAVAKATNTMNATRREVVRGLCREDRGFVHRSAMTVLLPSW